MQDRINSTRSSNTRRVAKWASLPALAMVAVLAGVPAAYAFGQQETSAQMDNDLNWQAASRGAGEAGAYAQAFHHGRVHVHGSRFER